MFFPVKSGLEAALKEVFLEGAYADKALEHTFRSNKKFGSRDRRQLAEAFYDIVRHYRLITELSGFNSSKSVTKMIDFYFDNQQDIQNNRARFDVPFCVQESVEDSFYEELKKQIGAEAAEKEILAMNDTAPVCLRTNFLKTTRDELQKALLEEEVETQTSDLREEALFLKERQNVFITKAFKQGFFEVQDLGSQKIAPMLDVKAGDRVVDACAGAGGKSLHLAALMQNKGRIIALDIHDWKLQQLKHRARRAGASTIESRHIQNQKVIKRLHASADRLLLDVPCTGSGVLKRNPDSKMKWSVESYQNLLQTQAQILDSYHKILKPNGKLVYATCSILPEENQNQIQAFLARHPDQWELEEEFSIRASEGPHDGFYAVRLAMRS